MAIVIKDMKMPETCGICSFCVCWDVHEADYNNCCITDDEISHEDLEQKKANCPLTEVPDAIIESYAKLRESYPSDIGIAIIPTKAGVPLHEIQTREWQKGEDK